MKITYSILILLVCLASPEARAQDASKKPNYPLLLNISVLEIDLDPSEELEAIAHDRARVATLLAERKARKIAVTQMYVRPGETSTFRVGNRIPIQVGTVSPFDRQAQEAAPTIQYEEIGLRVEALLEMVSEDTADINLKIEIKEIDRSTGNLTPSMPLKFLNSRAILRFNERVALLGVNGNWLRSGPEASAAQSGAGTDSNLVVLLTVRRAN